MWFSRCNIALTSKNTRSFPGVFRKISGKFPGKFFVNFQNFGNFPEIFPKVSLILHLFIVFKKVIFALHHCIYLKKPPEFCGSFPWIFLDAFPGVFIISEKLSGKFFREYYKYINTRPHLPQKIIIYLSITIL